MRPDKTTVYDLFYNQRRFAVPLYQRPYVWSLEAQWRPLWQDIEDKALAVSEGLGGAPHFLGAIVTGQRQIFRNQINAWDIIDGQQRLTTLQVLLQAFKDLTARLHEDGGGYALDLQRITRNEGKMESPDESFKVWPTNSDRDVFREVMTAGSIDNVLERFPAARGRRRRPAPRLADAYVFFYRAMERFLSVDAPSPKDVGSRSEALFTTFRQHLQVVNIELEQGDDPQVIFESLNGRGVPLLPSDLVRNLVFMRAASTSPETADTLYESYWKKYDLARYGNSAEYGPWWKQEERQGRLKRPRLDLFLFYYVQFKTEQEVHIGHLFQEFRKWWERSGAQQPAAALAELDNYSQAFASWLEPEGSSQTAEFSRWLAALDTATLYPLLFHLLLGDSRISQDDKAGILGDLESFLVRRAVCGLTNKGYNRLFMNLLKKLRALPTTSRAAFRAELMAGKGDFNRWPSDEEFGRAFIHRPAYQVIRRPVIRRILEGLERAMITTTNDEVEFKSLSIEHVMPQEWQKHWPLEAPTEDAVEYRDTVLQTFGNLTLVTPSFNTKLSNHDFDTKKAEIADTSRLLLNRRFWRDDLDAWDETAIRSRSRELFEIARRRWAHPVSPDNIDEFDLDRPPEKSLRIDDDEEVTISEPAISAAAAESLLVEFMTARSKTHTGV